MSTDRDGPQLRLLALGGLLGPAAFVAGWAVNAARLDGHSPVDDAISSLAQLGAPTRSWMTAALVAFGIGVPLYSLALRAALPGPAWMTAAVSGASALAVAALPLGGSVDAAHGVAAVTGYVALAATPVLAAGTLRRSGRIGAAALSTGAGVVTAAALAMTATGAASGLWQRIGLTVADLWIATTAVAIVVRGPDAVGPAPR